MAWNLKDDRPIYSQLVEQVALRIIRGVYPAGHKLPSVRELAAEAAVNPNTMQRALTELERGGLIYTQRTSGRYITDSSELIEKAKSDLARAEVSSFLENMRALGIDPKQALSAARKITLQQEDVGDE